MLKQVIIIISLLILGPYTYGQQSNIEFSSQFLSLMRYQKTLFGGYQSAVKSKEYFLAKDGMTNPTSELNASIREITSPPIKDMNKHPKCLFPARVKFLKKYKKIPSSINLKDCEVYQAFVKKLSVDSVSLIFSSYFIEKPASTFGHTFLRLRSKTSIKQNNDLLDYGVDFSAQVDTVNPIVYGYKGITGGFKGEFTLMPYYVKVKEYNDMESRDLWDYELNLSDNEVDYFQAHLYEMNRAYFDYYYLSENCSYHILAFLDAIKPEWKLLEELGIAVPPVDTVYALYKNDEIIRNVKFRPASYTKINLNIKNMDKYQSSLFQNLINKRYQLSEIKNNESDIFVLDTYNLYVDFENAEVDTTTTLANKEKLEYRKQKFQINKARSKLTARPKQISYQEVYDKAPHKGHLTGRFDIRNNVDTNGDYLQIGWRGALHDKLDTPNGFLPMSTTELFSLEFTYNKYQDQQFRLSEVRLANIEAYRPVRSFANNISFQLEVGYKEREMFSNRNLSPYLDLNIGQVYGSDSFIFGLLAATQNAYIYNSNLDYILSYGPKLFFVYSHDKYSIHSSYQYLFRNQSKFNKTQEVEFESRYHLNKKMSFKIGYEYLDKFYQQGYAGLNLFY
ncbi:DUF4105 domain-containing protein [Halobacteriovorax vibrionivorans]|uniref:DUF4105 domain-containing protein n=1 Tax=Halobacteriovorax vibrionivorans TaxID=2152716 RepID=A0ABY0IF53_9BACT|nr:MULTISPECIES: DUF4105 domain-containing protein [Halobacteriovorax]RZF21267.1 DUF4105 domain-containing protein [Halobacteriovorax vibrionivorans]TGD47975.1 DUF4105 domain-containing protein [Halobacteriovorax sp. Y22]